MSEYSLPALLITFPPIPFTTEEITNYINEAAIGANKVGRNLPSYFFISCFTVSVIFFFFIPALTVSQFNLLFFQIPALTAPFQLTFLSNLFIAFEAKLLTNPSKLLLFI